MIERIVFEETGLVYPKWSYCSLCKDSIPKDVLVFEPPEKRHSISLCKRHIDDYFVS